MADLSKYTERTAHCLARCSVAVEGDLLVLLINDQVYEVNIPDPFSNCGIKMALWAYDNGVDMPEEVRAFIFDHTEQGLEEDEAALEAKFLEMQAACAAQLSELLGLKLEFHCLTQDGSLLMSLFKVLEGELTDQLIDDMKPAIDIIARASIDSVMPGVYEGSGPVTGKPGTGEEGTYLALAFKQPSSLGDLLAELFSGEDDPD